MEKDKKLVGITCDNYKIDEFKKELTAKGYIDFEVKYLRKDLSVIRVSCFESDYPAIGKICEKVENHFKAMKN